MSSRKEATREAILDAARILFEVEDYVSVGLDSVAKKAGVSRQAIYLHFDSKAALLRSLHEQINVRDVEPAMRRVWQCHTAVAALEAFVAASAEVVPKIIGIANALETPRRVDPDVEATWEAPVQGRYADCLRLADWLKRDGALASGVKSRDAADILWMMASIRSYDSLVVHRGWSSQRWKRWVHSTLRHLLLDPP